MMQPVQICLVIGKRGSGVSTLLKAFGARADADDTTIVDGLSEPWDALAMSAWLKQNNPGTKQLILAANDPKLPRHVLQALADDPELAASFRLDAMTCAIDARMTEDQVGAAGPSGRLFAIADRIVLTQCDRVRSDAVTRLAKALKALNPPAPILRARNGDIGPARLVDSSLFDPVDGSIDIDRWLCEAAFGFEASRRGVSAPNPGEVQSPLGRPAGFFAVTIDQPLDSTVLSVFLKLLMSDRGAELLRLKGIVATDDHPDRPALIDGREHLIQPLLWLPAWPTADRRSRLVFTTADASETWIRTLLNMLSDELKLQAFPELQLATVREAG